MLLVRLRLYRLGAYQRDNRGTQRVHARWLLRFRLGCRALHWHGHPRDYPKRASSFVLPQRAESHTLRGSYPELIADVLRTESSDQTALVLRLWPFPGYSSEPPLGNALFSGGLPGIDKRASRMGKTTHRHKVAPSRKIIVALVPTGNSRFIPILGKFMAKPRKTWRLIFLNNT